MKMNASMVLVSACLIASVTSAPKAQAPSGPQVWQVPAEALVTADRKTGRVSIMMPREVNDWSGVEARFAQWRKAPLPGSGPFPATRVEDPTFRPHGLSPEGSR